LAVLRSIAKKETTDTSVPAAETIVIGAGPAGLGCAAALRKIGKSVVVLEQADRVRSSWRRHYDRLRLHTPKRHSGLPGLPMPDRYKLRAIPRRAIRMRCRPESANSLQLR
jgi:cation diffusion facilitator CzcD-associated flavoprotein CzcO